MNGSSFTRRGLCRGAAFAGAAALGAGRAVAAPEPAWAGPSDTADLELINGRFVTLDRNSSIASSIAIQDGRIVQVGERVARARRVVDLKGATVVPGLIDAHHHIYWAFDNPGCEARKVEHARSIEQLLAAFSERARTVPVGQFVTCNGGWDRGALKEKRLPTLRELDKAVPDRPAWLCETQTEAAWIDSSTAELLPAVTNSRGVAFFRERGIKVDAATGHVPWTESVAALRTLQSDETRLNDAIDYAASLGLTMIHDFGNGHATDNTLREELLYMIDPWRRGELKLRVRLRLRGAGLERLRGRMENGIARFGDDVIRLNGFGEGLGGVHPALQDSPTDNGFVDCAKLVAQYGWSAHIHSVTVEENQAHITAFREADKVSSIKDLRWSLAHVNDITPDLVRQLMALGAGVSGDSFYGYTDLSHGNVFGPPWRMLVDSGIPLGCGSDGSGTADVNPWSAIYCMVTGRNSARDMVNPGQTISRTEALRVHTVGTAWHSFDDHQVGTLEAGKLADLAVLSDDVLTVAEDDLRLISSTMTMQGGKVVHGQL